MMGIRTLGSTGECTLVVGSNNNGIMQLCVFHSSQLSAMGVNMRMGKLMVNMRKESRNGRTSYVQSSS